MDIQVRYQNEQTTYNGVQSFDDLLQEIEKKYPLLTNFELSYQDEEGDTIQVSNTSDIIAITDLHKVIIQMEAQINQNKVQELEKAKKVEELRQKRLEEQKRKKLEELQKEMNKLQELSQEKLQTEQQYREQADQLNHLLIQLSQFQNQPLAEFKKVFYDSDIFDQIREKEQELLVLEDKKGFDTKLKAIQKDVQETFEKLFSKRTVQHQENYQKWLENKHKIQIVNQQIAQKEIEKQGKLQKLDDKLKKVQESVAKMKAELNVPQQIDDLF
ncbi:unnamed protein product (macronuclear) [Paramecium tetraurelia]|uniref:PB1 domain-containing protein n=1 Tax=Paramecium tetraurelia TaxID=5888 RepID=A0C330_PARTE|nr:uncharacterized protein GSPATT00034675001 [Paramecium tetraurelia]CAK65197.1 unnamed protein product [Paramecium tetraurelia]|eukprot:XP_001432594.1 hypothetical protein (macronuclear) [Paramecium tetraurelia strain d4-2]